MTRQSRSPAKSGKALKAGAVPKNRQGWRKRFEQWACHPTCEANVLSAVLGVSMHDVAKAEGVQVDPGQSPFAIARGQQFERSLLDNHARRLIDELRHAGLVDRKVPVIFHDLRITRKTGAPTTLDEAEKATHKLLHQLASRKNAVHLIAAATLGFPGVMVPKVLLIPDVLLLRPSEQPVFTVTVGEIKAYPDRAGYTDVGQLAVTRAQAGAYIYGLGRVFAQLKLNEHFTVDDRGLLVLIRPGSNLPSIRANEDLKFQVRRAEVGFADLDRLAKQSATLTLNQALQAVQTAPTNYREGCLGFCPRATLCHHQALKQSLPCALGDDMAQFMGPISLKRGFALLNHAQPANAIETEWLGHVQALVELLA